MDRCDAPPASRRAHLYVLGERRGVPPQRRLPHGLPDAHAQSAAAAQRHRRRQPAPRARKAERPRAGVGAPVTQFVVLYAAMYAAYGVASPFLPAFVTERGLQ